MLRIKRTKTPYLNTIKWLKMASGSKLKVMQIYVNKDEYISPLSPSSVNNKKLPVEESDVGGQLVPTRPRRHAKEGVKEVWWGEEEEGEGSSFLGAIRLQRNNLSY